MWAAPDDGYAYSPIELTAIWEIAVDPDALATARSKIFAFHEHMHVDGKDPLGDHQRAANLILRDCLAQISDPDPVDLTELCRYCGEPWIGTRTSPYSEIAWSICCNVNVKAKEREVLGRTTLGEFDKENDGA